MILDTVTRRHLQSDVFSLGLGNVEGPLLGLDQRRQFGKDESGRRPQIPLALQRPAEPGEVGLQPVLLGVFLRGLPQVPDHFVDVIYEGRHLALCVH